MFRQYAESRAQYKEVALHYMNDKTNIFITYILCYGCFNFFVKILF